MINDSNLPPQVLQALATLKEFLGPQFHVINLPESIPPDERQRHIARMQEFFHSIGGRALVLVGTSTGGEIAPRQVSESKIYKLCSDWAMRQGAELVLFSKVGGDITVISDAVLQKLIQPRIRYNAYTHAFFRVKTTFLQSDSDRRFVPGMRFAVGVLHPDGVSMYGYHVVSVDLSDPKDPCFSGELTGAVSFMPEHFESSSDNDFSSEYGPPPPRKKRKLKWPAVDVLYSLRPSPAAVPYLDSDFQQSMDAMLNEDGPQSYSFWHDVFVGD